MSTSSTPSGNTALPVSTPGSNPDASAPTPGQSTPLQRSVKRPRPVKSCTECRKRKLRCDRLLPCSQCQKSRRVCRYAAEHESVNGSDGSDVEMGDGTTRPPKRNCPPAFPPPIAGDTRHLSDLSASSGAVARDGDALSSSLVEALVSRMDRLEKQVMVGYSPARTDYSIARGHRTVGAAPDTIRGLTIKKDSRRTRFFGQNSSRVMLNLVGDLMPPPSLPISSAPQAELTTATLV